MVDTSGYIVERLDRTHERTAFVSGVEPLDLYLHRQASQDVRRRLTTVYVLVPLGSTTIAGYYTLSSTAISFVDLPDDITRKLPRYPHVSATLIGRLAVDHRYRGQGLGGRLLFDAFARSLRISEEIASTMVVVDAKDEAARGFYERYGFRVLLDQQTRLFLPMETIVRNLNR